MKLDKKMVKLLNEQFNAEMYSAYLYLDFSNYFEEKGLNGFAKCSLKLFVSSSMHSFSSSQAEVSMAVNLILLLCYLRCYYFLTQK